LMMAPSPSRPASCSIPSRSARSRIGTGSWAHAELEAPHLKLGSPW
jgi:hypothetical protein